MASKYNIVFDVGVSDKSIGEIRSKVEKAFEKKINIKEYSDFDGLAAITNHANQVVKYIGSFREGLESVGFIIDKDLKKIEKFNTVVGAALPNLKWFSGAVQTAKSGHNTESNEILPYLDFDIIAEAKKQIKNMVDAFDAPTAKMLVHGIAGDSLGSFFKNDKEFNTFISEYVKSLGVQGDRVSDTYDTLKNNIAQKKSELEQTLSSMSSSSFSGTLQDAKDNVKNLQSEFSQAIAGFALDMFYFYAGNSEIFGYSALGFMGFFITLGFIVYSSSINKIHDLTELDTLQRLAYVDYSTNVKNRTAFYNFVENFNGPEEEYCLIIFDLNDLKKINDSLGHLYGDKVIKSFSQCAVKSFVKGDIYRVGGDEFIAVLKNTNDTKVHDMVQKFEKLVREQTDVQYKYNVAYGYQFFTPKNGNDFYNAQKSADQKMYVRKSEMKQNEKLYAKRLITDN